MTQPGNPKRPGKISPQLQQTLEGVYAFIEAHVAEHGFPPTLREIGAVCHISKTTSSRYLDRLEQQGRIARDPGIPRGIRLL